MGLNYVVEMGRITADPELKSTPNGVEVTSFTIAVDRYSKNGEHPEANFIDCVAWKEKAKVITNYFHKGSRIIVEGELQTRNYKDKKDVTHKVTEILVSDINFVDKKSDSNNNESQAPAETTFEDSSSNFETVDDQGELPFN